MSKLGCLSDSFRAKELISPFLFLACAEDREANDEIYCFENTIISWQTWFRYYLAKPVLTRIPFQTLFDGRLTSCFLNISINMSVIATEGIKTAVKPLVLQKT